MLFCITKEADKGSCVTQSDLWRVETWGHSQDFICGQFSAVGKTDELLDYFRVCLKRKALYYGEEHGTRE